MIVSVINTIPGIIEFVSIFFSQSNCTKVRSLEQGILSIFCRIATKLSLKQRGNLDYGFQDLEEMSFLLSNLCLIAVWETLISDRQKGFLIAPCHSLSLPVWSFQTVLTDINFCYFTSGFQFLNIWMSYHEWQPSLLSSSLVLFWSFKQSVCQA